MMMYLVKSNNTLIPAYAAYEDEFNKIGNGEIVKCSVVVPRNPAFHRKFFALLNVLYDAFDPAEGAVVYKGHDVAKSFEQFREDIIILAGYREAVFRIDGSFVMKAKSISFANMKEKEFQKLYSAVIDVGLKRVAHLYETPEQLDEAVNKIISFA